MKNATTLSQRRTWTTQLETLKEEEEHHPTIARTISHTAKREAQRNRELDRIARKLIASTEGA
jgi:hypothetical protein